VIRLVESIHRTLLHRRTCLTAKTLLLIRARSRTNNGHLRSNVDSRSDTAIPEDVEVCFLIKLEY
jgi:hypothetical protein